MKIIEFPWIFIQTAFTLETICEYHIAVQIGSNSKVAVIITVDGKLLKRHILSLVCNMYNFKFLL